MMVLQKHISINEVRFDVLLIIVLHIAPTFCHLADFSIRVFEPFRLAILASVILFRNTKNAYLLACVLPVFSLLVMSNPLPLKSLLMAIELIANVFLLSSLSKMMNSNFMACFISVVGSKILYYFLKIIFIKFELMDGRLFTTPIYIQALIIATISLWFYLSIKFYPAKGEL